MSRLRSIQGGATGRGNPPSFVITRLHSNGGRTAFCAITQGIDGHRVV